LLVLGAPIEGDPAPSEYVVVCTPFFADVVGACGLEFDWENYVWRTDDPRIDDEGPIGTLFGRLNPYLISSLDNWKPEEEASGPEIFRKAQFATLLELNYPGFSWSSAYAKAKARLEPPQYCPHGAKIDPKVVCMMCAKKPVEKMRARAARKSK
jgi:hypothetical protein